MIYLYSLLLLTAAAVAYCISQLWCFRKLKWGKHIYGFWGVQSDKRKYLNVKKAEFAKDEFMAMFPLSYYRTANHKPFKKWYYTTFNIAYTEAFPGSATAFVALTDGYHACQAVATSLICLSLSILTPHPIIMWLAFRTAWGIAFTVTYKLAGR